MKKIVILLILVSYSIFAKAQAPANDNCETAIELTDIKQFCSPQAAFTNEKSTPSGYGAATCFANNNNDVWFKFTPLASDINIIIDGKSGSVTSQGGTLTFPEAALYYGDCGGTLQQIACASDATGQNIISLYKGGLVIGATCYLRVQGRNGKLGTFRICTNNFNPPKVPGGDCSSSAAILCDQNAFVVQSVNGAGNDTKEANDATCFKNGTAGDVESNSTWFKWTCDKTGTLEFTLFPLKIDDDLDFVIYELPNGPKDCSSKTLIRCMASGDTKTPSQCMGPTGLKAGQTDLSEDAGCTTPGKDNFLKPLDMISGKSYALVVNNFTSAKVGFNLQFGGSGTFLGPVAKFSSDNASKKVCYGQKVTFKDESQFSVTNGAIVKWTWAFGENSQPATANTKGPHTITFTTPGKKYIALTIETDKGCQITTVDTFLVDKCCNTVNIINTNPQTTDLKCPSILEGAADPKASSILPITYKWSEAGSTDPKIVSLGQGSYFVTITNTAKCEKIVAFSVLSPADFKIDTIIKRPTCNGGVDGAITINVTGATPPYQFDWGAGFTNNNNFGNLKNGFYKVVIKDANNCIKALTIKVNELELILDPTIKALTQPSCFGGKDGKIVVEIGNGALPFKYDFGSGFQSDKILSSIGAGNYKVTVSDNNLCKGLFNFVVGQPTPVTVKLDTTNVTCFGLKDGKSNAVASGGVGPYTYNWGNNITDANARNLAPGIYIVTVTDSQNCTTTATTGIVQPPKLSVDVITTKDNICFGDKKGVVTILGNGGVPPYQYSLDGLFFQKDTAFRKLGAGQYSISIKDTSNCVNKVDLTIKEADPLLVSAGGNQTVELGYSTQLNSTVTPFGRNVKYLWAPVDSTISCKDCPNPVVKPYNTTIYTLKIVDETNCMAVDRVVIDVYKKRPIFIPTAFTPTNQDGVNDRFIVFGGPAARRVVLFRIFDRWGEMLFETTNTPLNDNSFGWDGIFRGKPMQPAIYTYYVVIEFIDNEKLTYKGDVMLMD